MILKQLFEELDINAILEEMVLSFPYNNGETNFYKVGYQNILNTDIYEKSNIILTIEDIPGNSRPVGIYYKNGYRYGMTCNDWSLLLSYQVDENLFSKYTKEYIACVFLIEICFMGNSETENKKASLELVKTLEKAVNSEGYPAEETFNHLKQILGKIPPIPLVGEKYKNIHGEVFEVVLVADDVMRDRTMVGLKKENQEVFLITVDDMLKNIEDIKFSNGKHQKYRYQKIFSSRS